MSEVTLNVHLLVHFEDDYSPEAAKSTWRKDFSFQTICFVSHLLYKASTNHKSLDKLSLITSHRWDWYTLLKMGTLIFPLWMMPLGDDFTRKQAHNYFQQKYSIFVRHWKELSSSPANVWVVSWVTSGFKIITWVQGIWCYETSIRLKKKKKVQDQFTLYCYFSKVFIANRVQYCTNR